MIATRGPHTDADLVTAFRAGDADAFAEIHTRYAVRLEKFARRILASNPAVAEDVVQEAMLRASRALRRDERHIDLKPWLFRLTRNCALDELARVKTDTIALDAEDTVVEPVAAPAGEPEVAAERHATVRDVLGDLAALPEEQRHALLRREVDGLSHERIAAELELSPQATKSLVFRARANLVREREARSADCLKVRASLLEAADAHRRAPAAALRHIAHCSACRAFRRDLKTSKASFAVLDPGLLLLGLGAGGGVLHLVVGKGVAVKGAVAAGALAATAGVVVLGTTVFGPGEPAPQAVRSPAVPQGRLAQRAAVPAGTAIVEQRLRIAAGTGARPRATLACPAGHVVADLLPPRGTALRVAYTGGTAVGVSRTARVALTGPALPRDTVVTVGVLCRRPTATGSIRAADQRSAVTPTHRVTVSEALLLAVPGGAVRGAVRRGQPVAVRAVRGAWRRVITDAGARGWVRATALTPLR